VTRPVAGIESATGIVARLAVAALVLALTNAARAQTVPLYSGVQARFATADEGREILSARDEFTTALSPYDRSARTGRPGIVTEQEYLDFVGRQAIDWTSSETAIMSRALASVSSRLRALTLHIPPQVLLVKTTGNEEAQTAYTRSYAIIVPQRYLSGSADDLETLLTHELFHVISRNAPARKAALYAIVGFRDCGPLQWPPELEQRRITNPDAPDTRYCMRLQHEGTELIIFPVLFAREETFNPSLQGTYLSRMQFRLLSVKQVGDTWLAQRIDGEPVLYEPAKLPAYSRATGRNTRYTIHPEEVLADNFIYLVNGERDLPTPAILDELRRELARPVDK